MSRPLDIEQLLVLDDNYIWLLHDPDSGATAVVDPALAPPVLARLAERGWTLTDILITHHHHDHTGGIRELKDATGATVWGSPGDAPRIPGLDRLVNQGDEITIGTQSAQVLAVPGHTLGHLAYWFADSDALFCGDTLFLMGCGRLFEGSAAQMAESLDKLSALPEATQIYCAHEYTAANARFALAVDPDNPLLQARVAGVVAQRAAGLPTVPAPLGLERATNPFLRGAHPELAQAAGLPVGSPAADVFAALRRMKDSFRG